MIACRVLGPVEVLVDGAAPPPELLWRKNVALLVYLARSPRHARTREHLLGLFWGDKPDSAARHSLNEALRVIRRHSAEGAVESAGDQVRLAGGAVELDTDRFESLTGSEDWDEAADLVVGEFMEGFAVPDSWDFDNWLSAERMTWREASVHALVQAGDRLLVGGDARQAGDLASRSLALDGTSDLAARLAMRSAALAGDRAHALAVYDALAARLDEELGMEPDTETLALADRVRLERTWILPERPASGEPTGEESRRAPLLGRSQELERLLAAWRDCHTQGRPTLAIIEGDTGTGKTRLGEETAARARLDGAWVGTIRAVEADQAEAWSGVLALARGALLEAPGVDRAPAAAVAAFARHLPAWAARLGAEVEPAPAPLGRAWADVLGAIAAVQPVVLLLDDAHWLDRDTLLALATLYRDLSDAALFVLLTRTPHPERTELDNLQARIGREVPGLVMRLGPISADALRDLARWALPGYDRLEIERVARRVMTDSAGLPLLAVELLHAIAGGLDLGMIQGAWPAPSRTLAQTLPGGLPAAVVAAIRVGFRRLSAHTQTTLAAAAALDERVDERTLARATGLEADELSAALDELEWLRWLVAETRGYSFVARIVRDVVAQDMLTAGQRRRIIDAVGHEPPST